MNRTGVIVKFVALFYHIGVHLVFPVGYTTDEVLYNWMTTVEIDPGVTLSQFELGQIEQKNVSKISRFGESEIFTVSVTLTISCWCPLE